MNVLLAKLASLLAILAGLLGFQQAPSIIPISVLQMATSTVAINGANIIVEIADTEEERSRGLSGRTALGENEGMIFIFDEPQMPDFWMKDMRFPIDMVWIDENWKIVGLDENVAPETYPIIFYPPEPIKYVLEVNAGFTAANQIIIGDQVVLN